MGPILRQSGLNCPLFDAIKVSDLIRAFLPALGQDRYVTRKTDMVFYSKDKCKCVYVRARTTR